MSAISGLGVTGGDGLVAENRRVGIRMRLSKCQWRGTEMEI